MEDLSKFPKRLLVTALVMIVFFLGLVSITFFYHPVIPFPSKITMTVGERLSDAPNSYRVQFSGAPQLQPGKTYKVKVFMGGEGHFSTLTTEVVNKNEDRSYGVISGITKLKMNDVFEGVTYKDSLSPQPLVKLMFK